MISHINKGADFGKTLNYLLGKEAAHIIDGNLSDLTPDPNRLAQEFEAIANLNRRVKHKTYHISLSVPAHEPLNEKTWRQIARQYLILMKLDANQYIAVKHEDTAHHHIHLLVNRVRTLDKKCTRDSWDFTRSMKAVRTIEAEFGLEHPNQTRDRSDEMTPTQAASNPTFLPEAPTQEADFELV
ncbi:MAG: relaxase/mobilization nuclease domain-containing protein [Leptolyngbyaceae cyanobacterium MO_188.B28]|nr:relaxase/mobilization nuclease domain-containing protein [Leptolyngbyaceae cyanobacterium MO_188.B28]